MHNKDLGLKAIPNRQGKVFSYKYLSKSKEMNETFRVLEDGQTKNTPEVQKKLQNIVTNVQNNMDQSHPQLNFECFLKLREYFVRSPNLCLQLRQLCFSEGDVQVFEKYFREDCGVDGRDWHRLADLVIRILIETVEFEKEIKSMSKQQASRQKINRYIFIMNEVQ